MADSNSVASAETGNAQGEVHVIDIPLLKDNESRAEDSFKDEEPIYSNWSKCCSIYRVPRKLRSVNEAAYTPQVVSIGPYHHGKPDLKAMEPLKSKYLKALCKRARRSREDVKNIMDQDYENRVRACYAGTFQEIKGGDFVDMIMTDAGFIIELFLRSAEGCKDDYILCKPWLKKCIEQDLILLENQLPFFAIKRIFKLVYNGGDSYNLIKGYDGGMNLGYHASPFLLLTRQYFYGSHDSLRHYSGVMNLEVKHFTDLLRSTYYRSFQIAAGGGKNNEGIGRLRNVTKLKEAGVDFAPAEPNET